MSRILGAAVIGLALVAAGCGPIAVLESGGSADSVAMLPGEVDLASAADESYQYEAYLGYRSATMDDGSGPEPQMTGVMLGFNWYFMGAVENDDVAIELQPVDQKASSARLMLGFGSLDYDGMGPDDSDIFLWELGVTFILGEDTPVDGLGFELDYGKMTIEDFMGGTDDMEQTDLRFGVLYYIAPVEGLIAKLGYSTSTEDDGGAAEPETSGIDIGAEYYVAVGDGMYLDAELTLGFPEYDPDDGSPTEDIFSYLLSVDFYPMQFLGFGLDYGNASYDVDPGDKDVSTFGLHVVWNVEQVPGLDINLSWEKETEEVTGSNDDEESAIFFRVDYRF